MSDPLVALILATLTGIGLFLVFRPGTGWFWRWQSARTVNERVRREDALKHLHHQEYEGQPGNLQSIAGAVGTGTHGTGPTLQNLSASVLGAQLVLADGSTVICGPCENTFDPTRNRTLSS